MPVCRGGEGREGEGRGGEGRGGELGEGRGGEGRGGEGRGGEGRGGEGRGGEGRETEHTLSQHRIHYKEYLVDKINKNKLDPITIYETHKVKLILYREEMAVPERNENDLEEEMEEETDEEYRERLIKVRVHGCGQYLNSLVCHCGVLLIREWGTGVCGY